MSSSLSLDCFESSISTCSSSPSFRKLKTLKNLDTEKRRVITGPWTSKQQHTLHNCNTYLLCQWYHVWLFHSPPTSSLRDWLFSNNCISIYSQTSEYSVVWFEVHSSLSTSLFPYMCNERGKQSMQIYTHGWDFSPKMLCIRKNVFFHSL